MKKINLLGALLLVALFTGCASVTTKVYDKDTGKLVEEKLEEMPTVQAISNNLKDKVVLTIVDGTRIGVKARPADVETGGTVNVEMYYNSGLVALMTAPKDTSPEALKAIAENISAIRKKGASITPTGIQSNQ